MKTENKNVIFIIAKICISAVVIFTMYKIIVS